MEKRFKKDIQSLEQIFDFISDFLSTHKIDDAIAFSIDLVVEEIFTNMVKYNSNSWNDILINLNRDGDKLIIKLTDFDVDPFDVTEVGDYDVNQSLPDRKIGGLGLHLVRKMVDNIIYEYKNRQSRVILIKNLEPKDV